MELLGYWKIIRKRLWLIFLLVLIGGIAVTYYNQRLVSQYRTTTTLFLNPGAASPLLPYQAGNSVQALANTYVEFMRTRSFAQLVVAESGLPLSEGAVLFALSTQYVPETQFFRISATYPHPQVAQTLANTAARVLIAENMARQQATQEQLDAQRAVNPEVQHLLDLRTSLQEELSLSEQKIRSTEALISDIELRGPSEWNNQRLIGLRQELISLQSARANILTSLTQAQAAIVALNPSSGSSSLDTAVVVDEALLPESPLPQRTLQRTLMVLLFSLGAGIGLAVLLEYIDYTIKTPEELDAVYGMPALGVIGVAARHSSKNGSNPHLVTLHDSQSPIAEAFRSLRTSIGFSALTTPLSSLVVTSAGPSEGKTFIAANLAVSLAQGGKRVILVDTDLRKPTVHHLFGVGREPGFTDLLMERGGDPVDFLQATPVATLQLLTCGTLPPNPADLLGSPRSVEVMRQLQQFADIVVYDTPPAATVTDAAILAQHTDAVLQVVLAGQTRIDLVRRCKTVIEQVGAHSLGPVLNRVGDADLGYYSYYYSYGYYGEHGQNGSNGQRSKRKSFFRRWLPRRKRRSKVSSTAPGESRVVPPATKK